MAYYYSPFRKEYSPKQDGGSCPFCNSEVIRAEAVRDGCGKKIYRNIRVSQNRQYYRQQTLP